MRTFAVHEPDPEFQHRRKEGKREKGRKEGKMGKNSWHKLDRERNYKKNHNPFYMFFIGNTTLIIV